MTTKQTISLPSSPKQFTTEIARLLEKSHGMKRYFDREEILAAHLNSNWYGKAHPIWAIVMFGTPAVFDRCAEEYEINGEFNKFRKHLLRGFHQDHTDNWMDIVKIDSAQGKIGRKMLRWGIILSILAILVEIFMQFAWDLIFPNGNSF